MNRSTYRFTLDLQKHRSQMSIAVFVHDSAVRLIISLTDGGIPYHIESGGRAVFYGKRPDDTPLCHNCMIDDTGRIIYDFNDQTASVVGITHCQIRIYGKDGELITAPRFSIVADERLVYDADIENLADSPLASLDEIQFAEMDRVDAETARAEAEKARAEAEAERIEAETERIKSENERIEAEKKRQYFPELKADKTEVNNLKTRIIEIEKHLAPKYIITDDTTAYTKDVPANACSKAQLNSVGGMTYIDEATNTFVDAKVTALKLRGANKLGGDALADAIVLASTDSKKDDPDIGIGTVTLPGGTAGGFTYTDLKPSTQYTIILYGYNKSKNTYSNLKIWYSDKSTKEIHFNNTDNTPSYVILHTDANKTITKIGGSHLGGTAVFEYDKCGIFEGHVTLEQFKEYEEKTIFEIPAEIQALPNYGKMFTELDLVNKKYIDRYDESDYLYLAWEYNGEEDWETDPFSTVISITFETSPGDSTRDVLGLVKTEKPYDSISFDGVNFTLQKRVEGLRGHGKYTRQEYDNVFGLNSLDNLVNELFGTITVIATNHDAYVTEHDISSYIDNNIIEVIEKGRIEFVNENKQPVPSSVSYMIDGHLFTGGNDI